MADELKQSTKTLQNLLPNTRYLIRVKGYNYFNIESEWSDALDYTTPKDLTVPGPVTSLYGNYESPNLLIYWNAPVYNTNGTPAVDIAYYEVTITINGLSRAFKAFSESMILYFDQQVQVWGVPSASVNVSVAAVDVSQNYSFAASSTFTNAAPGQPIAAPTLNGTVGGIVVQMNSGNIADFDHFELQASMTNESSYSTIFTGDSPMYVHTGNAPGQTWYYKYRRVDKFGQVSSYSPSASASPTSVIAYEDIYTAAQNINSQTGTSYTFLLADQGKLVTFDNGSPISVTVPKYGDVAFAIGQRIDLVQMGAGQVTVQGDSGVTINATPGLNFRAQYSGATLLKIGTNNWILLGDLVA